MGKYSLAIKFGNNLLSKVNCLKNSKKISAFVESPSIFQSPKINNTNHL